MNRSADFAIGARSGGSFAPRGGTNGERGQALASLQTSRLRDKFFSWRGSSGRRYVCSTFPREERAIVAEFAGATVIGVERRGSVRRPVCVLAARDFRAPASLNARDTAGVDEWHVHFYADEEALRDLAGALLH